MKKIFLKFAKLFFPEVFFFTFFNILHVNIFFFWLLNLYSQVLVSKTQRRKLQLLTLFEIFFFNLFGLVIQEIRKGSTFYNIILHFELVILKNKEEVQKAIGICRKQQPCLSSSILFYIFESRSSSFQNRAFCLESPLKS